ncbi:MAG: NADP-dependent isocitrate dehydrogenase [Flavobacteriales bacterium]|nr:NADP-dependent isocitrate dehydrogenase [Flavobacteriales bacterium]MCW8912440.1 NADP-dependent isocitrate dehydrogenase [Flavobacteriales bacterium]MCW8936524.1 NADP-dependent isocitrate dehydrogenase [Flavobacteriales bacterium]MCW8969593.1 NADP-dependent isocitrate dehydrogenase [Flavobacteriales bacterium]MCW8989579.1 NADP-dependent isocitrate dehydrogenase [Flavobacteriales bacterium]
MGKTTITIAKGDGIGPEIMDATLKILKASGAPVQTEEIEIGEKIYLSGNTAGIEKNAWESIIKNKVFLKAPITTPQGGGYKSLNVTMRKTLGLYANVRPCVSFHPYIKTKHPKMDLVIIRENEEDLYAGIEHQQTDEVVQCLKLISRPGCEKIIRYAFEYAKYYDRKKVTCFTKDNIMKQTDGLFHSIFNEIAKEYPTIENEHWIIDIGAAKVADSPEDFDVIVMPNLYGDVVSDIAAQITGSVGLAGSSNIGETCSMFEAIHGSASTIAGQNIANPSGLIQASVMMLNHIGLNNFAEKIQNALLKTIEDGIHTVDIYDENVSKQKVNTEEFTEAVIKNLGNHPKYLPQVVFNNSKPLQLPKYVRKQPRTKKLVGVDVFVDWQGSAAAELANKLQQISSNNLKLNMITNRGVKVWPNGFDETFCTDHWRCRFIHQSESMIEPKEIASVLFDAAEKQIDIIKTENLYEFDGIKAYSLGQGQ